MIVDLEHQGQGQKRIVLPKPFTRFRVQGIPPSPTGVLVGSLQLRLRCIGVYIGALHVWNFRMSISLMVEPKKIVFVMGNTILREDRIILSIRDRSTCKSNT